MATHYEQREPAGQPTEVSGWAVGGVVFAATMLIMVGFYQALAGLVALLNADFYASPRNYTFDLDVTAWGWLHLVLGTVAALIGIGLIRRSTWAGVAGIVIAMLGALANFLFIPYQPIWSLVMIAINMWIIWSLTRPGAIRT
jgi:hypothetical protein